MSRFHPTSLMRGLPITLSPFVVVVSVFADVRVLAQRRSMPAVCKSFVVKLYLCEVDQALGHRYKVFLILLCPHISCCTSEKPLGIQAR